MFEPSGSPASALAARAGGVVVAGVVVAGTVVGGVVVAGVVVAGVVVAGAAVGTGAAAGSSTVVVSASTPSAVFTRTVSSTGPGPACSGR